MKSEFLSNKKFFKYSLQFFASFNYKNELFINVNLSARCIFENPKLKRKRVADETYKVEWSQI